jgi:hypothetical protein
MIRHLILALVLLGAVGCGTPQPTAADPNRAKAALQAGLEAWQEGGTEKSLKEGSPVIYFNDPVWRSGKQLGAYQIQSEQENGLSWRYEVELSMQGEGGRTVKQLASYTVDTDPALVVVRDP